MNAIEAIQIAPEIVAELEDSLKNPYEPPEPKKLSQACRQIDQMREATRKKSGILDVAVDLVRDARR